MDNPIQESNSSDQAAIDAFANVFGEPQAEQPKPQAQEATNDDDRAAEILAQEQGEQEQTAEPEVQAEEPRFKVKVDGKEIEVPASELVQGYQRQADYTKKTMEAAETRKAAEAEAQAARQQRDAYAEKLQGFKTHADYELQALTSQLTNELLETDPVEYLRIERTARERQAQIQQAQHELGQIDELRKHEKAEADRLAMMDQHEKLVAKIPEWKDPAKLKDGVAKLKEYLATEGFTDGANDLPRHLQISLAHKAMLYDAVMAKAKAAAQQVAKLPPKVERPGVTNSGNPDKRTSVMQNLKKSGGSDAAAVAAFSAFL